MGDKKEAKNARKQERAKAVKFLKRTDKPEQHGSRERAEKIQDIARSFQADEADKKP